MVFNETVFEKSSDSFNPDYITAHRKEYLTLGYEPIPCNGKRPVFNAWQKININANRITSWGSEYPDAFNTGIRTRYTPAVDIDVYDGEMVEKIRQKILNLIPSGTILERIGQPPKLLIPFQCDVPFDKVATIFKSPDGTVHKVEVLGDGQQFIADGIHPDTKKPYHWKDDNDLSSVAHEQLPMMDESLATKIIKIAADMMGESGWIEVDTKGKAKTTQTNGSKSPWAQAALNGECEKVRNAANGMRNDTLNAAAFSLGQIIGGGELDRGEVEQHLFEAARSLVDDDGKSSVRATIKSGITAGLKEPRATPNNDNLFEAHKTQTEASNIFSAKEMRQMIFQPIKWVVPGFIAEGLTLFCGKPKIGKSWLLLHAANATAKGNNTLGDIRCEQGDVLYCALEDNQRRLQRRMEKLFPFEQWSERLNFMVTLPRLAEGGLTIVERWIQHASNPRLVIIDTLARVRMPNRKDQTTYDADYTAIRGLQELAGKYGVAIVLVHHLRKAESDDAFDTISGTLGLTGAADATMIIRRENNGVVLIVQGRDVEEIKKAVAFDRESCRWTIIGNAEEIHQSAERSNIIDTLKEINKPMTPNQIATAIGTKPVNVRNLLKRMLSDGLVKKAEYGRYGL